MYKHTVNHTVFAFDTLAELMAKASPLRSGDQLASIAARSYQERVAAQMALAELPLSEFLSVPLIPYETDEVTRLIFDTHDKKGFNLIAHLTVGDFRNYILEHTTQKAEFEAIRQAITPEMAAAVSKIMNLQDMIAVSAKCEVVTRFRNTIGLKGRMATRLQPNHPTDDVKGILASTLDGLYYGSGDAVIGINPASDNVTTQVHLLKLLDELRRHAGARIADVAKPDAAAPAHHHVGGERAHIHRGVGVFVGGRRRLGGSFFALLLEGLGGSGKNSAERALWRAIASLWN
ncbi:MAG: ethanolamine ammonia-lyase subunit EutB [Chloroflexia bacterium]|nr:ethanolamine ammonia-lyase subunit EutB [Chloroflexia bacterium]